MVDTRTAPDSMAAFRARIAEIQKRIDARRGELTSESVLCSESSGATLNLAGAPRKGGPAIPCIPAGLSPQHLVDDAPETPARELAADLEASPEDRSAADATLSQRMLAEDAAIIGEQIRRPAREDLRPRNGKARRAPVEQIETSLADEGVPCPAPHAPPSATFTSPPVDAASTPSDVARDSRAVTPPSTGGTSSPATGRPALVLVTGGARGAAMPRGRRVYISEAETEALVLEHRAAVERMRARFGQGFVDFIDIDDLLDAGAWPRSSASGSLRQPMARAGPRETPMRDPFEDFPARTHAG